MQEIEKAKNYRLTSIAQMLGKSPETIRWYIHEKGLKARKVLGQYLIKGADLDEFLEANTKEFN